jgi:hypothetical protein
MSKKYIKGKDGKFKGSLPDPNLLPPSTAGAAIPAHPSNGLAGNAELANIFGDALSQVKNLTIHKEVLGELNPPDESKSLVKISKKIYPGDIAAYYIVEDNKEISGSVYPNANGTFTSTIDSASYGESQELSSTVYASAEEAEASVRNNLEKLGGYISSFDAAYETDGLVKIVSASDSAIEADATWQGNVDETFGPKTSWMRSDKTNRGATVQRYKTGYYIRIHDYKTSWDQEGELMLTKAYPDFDTANAFARYVVSGVADSSNI